MPDEKPMSNPDGWVTSGPIETIKDVMHERGITRRDLRPMIGSRGRVSDVLNKRRPLSLPMIRALVKHLGIPARMLIDEYKLCPAASKGRG